MEYTVERFNARQWTDDQMDELFSEGFPSFITSDPIAHDYIGHVWNYFEAYHIILVNLNNQPIGSGWGVPIQWNGEVTDLPSGYTDSLVRSVKGYENQITPNTFVICAGIVNPKFSGKGLAGKLIQEFKELATKSGLPNVIAPIRPTLKHKYPLTPINTYAQWVRSDGLPLDPWLRTHVRVGGKIVCMAPHSQAMKGTVEQWEAWTDMKLPSTGHYVIPNGLSKLYIDRELDVGTYTEPNIWVQHQ